MSATEYSKMMESSTINFEGNTLTDCCKDFLQGLLEKNFDKRLSFDNIFHHPWLVLIKDKIDEIVSKYSSDPDKMISMLNNTTLTNEYFQNKNYIEIDLTKQEEESSATEKMMKKKRKRSTKNNSEDNS